MITPAFRRYCQQHQIRLTPLREQILGLLTRQEQPTTAYALLDLLKIDNPKAKVMSVYRVLDFLQAHGLVHRIENLNAYMICHHLTQKHASQWLICEICGKAEEFMSTHIEDSIAHIESASGFRVNTPIIELMGVCKQCQKNAQ